MTFQSNVVKPLEERLLGTLGKMQQLLEPWEELWNSVINKNSQIVFIVCCCSLFLIG
jgi:hypothetical protein